MRRTVLGALVALVGCAGVQSNLADPSKRDVGTDCASTAECPATTVCTRGRCEYDGKIVAPAQSTSKGAHAPCTSDADCNGAYLCIAKFCEPRDLAHD